MDILKSNKTKNKQVGNIGEAKAYSYLVEKGYEILATNYKTKIGEIDIIAKDENGRIIFVEVKSRSTYAYGYGREAVTYKKQQTIRRVAEIYLLSNHKINSYTRFDVIELVGDKINHIEYAF